MQEIFWIIADLRASCGQVNEPIYQFHFLINNIYDFGSNFFPKKNQKYYLLLPFFFFVYLLPSFINKRPHNTLLVSEEGAIKHTLRAKFWPYGFDSVFWQVLIEFLFVVFFLFFLAALKIE